MKAEEKRAGVYIRVSGAEQAKGMGPDMQRSRCRALCESHGWPIAEQSEDLGLTGRNMTRPGLQAMLRAAAEGRIDVVCVFKLDRLARKARHLQEIWEDHLAKHGVELASATESIDTSNPMGRAMMGMTGVFAQMESELIQERTEGGRREKAMQGGFGTAVRSFGFRWDTAAKRPVIVPAEADVIKRIFDMAAGGHSVEGICKTLNRQGVNRRKGGEWWNSELQAIMRNQAYMGRFVTYTDPQTGEETLARPDLCPPAIVQSAVWQAAQGVTQAFRQHRRPAVKRIFLLSGFCTCGNCGERTLTIRQPDEKHAYYACNGVPAGKCDAKHIPAPALDGTVWSFVTELASRPDMLRACARRTTGELLPSWRKRIAQIGEDMKRLQARLRRAKELLEDPDAKAYTLDDFSDTKAQYEERMPVLQAEADELEEKIARAERERADVDWQAEVLRRAGDLDDLDLDGKRRLLSALGVAVTVWTVRDERGKLADMKVRLETYAAAITGLAPDRAMS